MQEKRTITNKMAERYRCSSKKKKTQILDEFVHITGDSRKYAIHILANYGKQKIRYLNGKPLAIKIGYPAKKRTHPNKGRPRIYDKKTILSLSRIWAFFDYLCGKRLAPMIQPHIDILAKEPSFKIDSDIIKENLSRISPATIDRLLVSHKKRLRIKGVSHTRRGTYLKNQIPVRVFYTWDERKLGFFEVDTVAHQFY